VFERPDFTDPAFAEHAWYFNAYKDALVPLCRGRVLDIGAGHGYLSRAAAEQEAVTSVLATDRHFDERLAQKHSKLTMAKLETEALIQRNFGLFDTIVATEHIEHLSAALHAPLLKFISEHLAPGGVFLGSMPEVVNSGNPFHQREYLAEEWRAVLGKYFQKVEIWFPVPLLYVWKAQAQ
jgi:2-polyprenyl-3-methyl-5-hydroxy-6-metoxy-1,4-benzoquinol methylase